MNTTVTIYQDLFSKKPHFITAESALDRIKQGKSIEKVLQIRNELDDERKKNLKQSLPSVCWSGTFPTERKDEKIKEHSGLICLDFDHVEDIDLLRSELGGLNYIYAFWLSPSGDGIKALALISDTSKHREHFRALQNVFPNLDKSGSNPSRVCFESYDPNLYINSSVVPFSKTIIEEKVELKIKDESNEIIKKLLVWLSNKSHAFVKGDRNNFIFKFAGACCRFGVSELECIDFCKREYFNTENSFSLKEGEKTIQSAYRFNKNQFASAEFSKNILIDKLTKIEVDVSESIEEDGKIKDVIYADEVLEDAINLYNNGFERVKGIGLGELDELFKLKKKEITLLSGYGNYGKSTFLKWFLLMRAIIFKEKYCLFSPEDAPSEEFYFSLCEIILGCNLLPSNPNRADEKSFRMAYEFVSNHFFFVYPKEISPSPEYIKERFLKMIITQKVDGVIIDPFNQLANDYSKSLGRDKYLETFLSDFRKFSIDNNIYGIIVAHPKTPKGKAANGNYECPDVFDIADGTMWNNKMDNILIYHKPLQQTHPDDPSCEIYTKKIRRKVVGKRGFLIFEFNRQSNRFIFNEGDVMAKALSNQRISFGYNNERADKSEILEQPPKIIINPDDVPF